jgi:hypothetical protein
MSLSTQFASCFPILLLYYVVRSPKFCFCRKLKRNKFPIKFYFSAPRISGFFYTCAVRVTKTSVSRCSGSIFRKTLVLPKVNTVLMLVGMCFAGLKVCRDTSWTAVHSVFNTWVLILNRHILEIHLSVSLNLEWLVSLKPVFHSLMSFLLLHESLVSVAQSQWDKPKPPVFEGIIFSSFLEMPCVINDVFYTSLSLQKSLSWCIRNATASRCVYVIKLVVSLLYRG